MCTTLDISLHRNRGIIDRKVVAQGKLLGVVRTIQETREGKRQGRVAERGNPRFFFLSSLASVPLFSAAPWSSFIFSGHVKSFLFRTRVHPSIERRACASIEANRTGAQQRFTSPTRDLWTGLIRGSRNFVRPFEEPCCDFINVETSINEEDSSKKWFLVLL